MALDRLTELVDRHKPTFWILVVLIVLSILFYVASFLPTHSLVEISERVVDEVENGAGEGSIVTILEEGLLHSFLNELLLHIAIALAVAAILIVSVEIHSSEHRREEVRLYRNQIAQDVWNAVFGRLLPNTLIQELDPVFKADYIRKGCTYTITFKPPYPELDQDNSVVVRRELSYSVQNIGNSQSPFKVRSFIYSPEEQKDVTLETGDKASFPRHIVVRIDGKEQNLSEIVRKDENGWDRDLEMSLIVGKNEPRVFTASEEECKLSDTTSYTQLSPVLGLKVIVRNHYQEKVSHLKVRLMHPNWQALQEVGEGVYEYEGGILPGQGFVVEWGKR